MKLKENAFRNFIKKGEKQTGKFYHFFPPFGKKEELGRIWGGGMA